MTESPDARQGPPNAAGRLVATVDYLDDYGGWCAILHCPPGCECGQRTIVSGFATSEAAQGFVDQAQAGWPLSPEAAALRGEIGTSQ